MNILLLDFNNYFNRTIKKYSSIGDYRINSAHYFNILGVNFIPNDGVTTEQIINFQESWEPNYIVCFDEHNEIKSRWFIIESIRLRNGQFKLLLKRDSVADYFESIINAPCFIEKGTIHSTSDVSIYNSEGMKFNQIKKNETLLKDKTNVGWLIGYYSKSTQDTQINVPLANVDYISVATRASWEYSPYINSTWNYVNEKEMQMDVYIDNPRPFADHIKSFSSKTGVITTSTDTSSNIFFNGDYNYSDEGGIDRFNIYFLRRISNIWNTYFSNQTEFKETDPLPSLNNKYIYITDEAKYYQISITTEVEGLINNTKITADSQLESELADLFTDYPGPGEVEYSQGHHGAFKPILYGAKRRIVLTEVTFEQLKTDIKAVSKTLTDAPYKMFAIPYGEIRVKGSGATIYNTLDSRNALNVVSSIALALDANIYDIQLLPFFPMIENIMSQAIADVSLARLTEHIDYEFIFDNATTPNVKGLIFFPSYSSFSFDINKSISASGDVEEFKIENETKFYRLMSPNGSSQFDFKVTKTGNITKFNVDCTYKPYAPYIHINPNWSKLYGEDYNDYRGLICKGDFSVPLINSQWQNYQLNNKNYLNAFNRETDSLELQYDYQRVGSFASAITGAIGAGVQGAATGALAGGGVPGAIAGAVVGTVSSAIGGAIDVGIQDRLHQEQMDLRHDQFTYSLQNIQARPYTLAKVSAFDYNNKIFPILEEYDCTDEEKIILENKLYYEGMTVMKISTINNYLDSEISYVRGNIILMENIEGDYHLINDIKNEVASGLRMKV